MSVTQFNNTTTKDGLVQKCEIQLFGDNGFGKISGNTNLLYIFANFANEALDWYAEIALRFSSKWRFDSSTYTTLPEGYTDLVSGQGDYTLDVNFLNIENIEVRDGNNSRWLALTRTSDDEIKARGESVSEYEARTGTPTEYKLMGNSVILMPKPNYSVTEGLKLGVGRGFAYFTYDDTTDTVGIPTNHARFISDYMSWLYARDRAMVDKTNQLQGRIIGYQENDIPNFYSNRDKDTEPVLRPLIHSNK